MKWEIMAENEINFYLKKEKYIADVKDRLIELEDDIMFPIVKYDDVLGRISFYVPTVEDEVLRRERIRESLNAGLKHIERRVKTIETALSTLNEVDRAVLLSNGSFLGRERVRWYRALRSFYISIKCQRNRRRLEFKLAVLQENGLENTPKAQRLLSQVG